MQGDPSTLHILLLPTSSMFCTRFFMCSLKRCNDQAHWCCYIEVMLSQNSMDGLIKKDTLTSFLTIMTVRNYSKLNLCLQYCNEFLTEKKENLNRNIILVWMDLFQLVGCTKWQVLSSSYPSQYYKIDFKINSFILLHGKWQQRNK